jgi:hypothetical protein
MNIQKIPPDLPSGIFPRPVKTTLLASTLALLVLHAGDSVCFAEVPKKKEVPARSIGLASRQLLIDGWDTRAVQKQFGVPGKIRKADFMISSNGHKLPDGLDEQWYYPMDLGHRLIAFKRGRVIFAIEEWSDF